MEIVLKKLYIMFCIVNTRNIKLGMVFNFKTYFTQHNNFKTKSKFKNGAGTEIFLLLHFLCTGKTVQQTLQPFDHILEVITKPQFT